MKHKGKVYLVGAGVCGNDMLTLRAAELVSKADVLVYDRLIDRSVLKLAKPGAELVYMGKETGEAHKQAEINKSLIALAAAGKTVVRLKSGDPFVFGRGGEEIKALRECGIVVEAVPGLSSAIALPTLAGIPLTVRGSSSAILVLTGHKVAEDEGAYFKRHAKFEGTLVLLMAIGGIAKIAGYLLEGGMPGEKSVVVITTPRGKVEKFFTTLIGLTREEIPPGPGVVVIGAIVEFGRRL